MHLSLVVAAAAERMSALAVAAEAQPSSAMLQQIPRMQSLSPWVQVVARVGHLWPAQWQMAYAMVVPVDHPRSHGIAKHLRALEVPGDKLAGPTTNVMVLDLRPR